MNCNVYATVRARLRASWNHLNRPWREQITIE